MKTVVLAYHNIGCAGITALLNHGFDIQADLYDLAEKHCFGADTLKLKRLKTLVKQHGQASDIQDGLYFMPHEEEGLSYVILLQLAKEKSLAITLVSKRIPEEIGFPRLLISDQAGISNSLEAYAIGKYAEGRLIHQTGAFNYPNLLSSFQHRGANQGHFEFAGFTHVIVQKHSGSAIIISSVTNKGYKFLPNIINNFVRQDYPYKKLIIIFNSDNVDEEYIKDELYSNAILDYEIKIIPNITLSI